MIAAVNGIGVGIGMTMLLHVDVAFIATTARLRAPFVPLGVVPEAAGSLLMPVVMGNQRAAEKLYTGEWITADEAVECGLALRAVAARRADGRGDRSRAPHRADAGGVAARHQADGRRLPDRRGPRRPAREDDQFRKMIGQPANMEAITAFLEKREPDFTKL